MIAAKDRVGELLEGARRRLRRDLITPEGVPLEISIAGHGERLAALLMDLAIIFGLILVIYIVLIFFVLADSSAVVGPTLAQLLAFIVRLGYFIHFELAWQGRTPGKKAGGLRVVNRAGGELTPGAVIARNLTREVEIFLPLNLWLFLGFGDLWPNLSFLGWLMIVSTLPLWNKGHLRAGDLIAGTQVIAMPKRALSADLSAIGARNEAGPYTFTPEQLAIYGAFELQVLEELLRRPDTPAARQLLSDVSQKISHKIGWDQKLDPKDIRRFLTDFYSAERAELERGQLFGRLKADKSAK